MMPAGARSDAGVSRRRSQQRALLLAIAITLGGVAPVFLVTGMGVQIRADLGLTESRLGLAVTGYFTVSAIGSVLAGRFTERIGAGTAVPISVGLATTAMIGLAVLTDGFSTLLVFLMLGGMGSAMAHPSANLTLARDIALPRQGVAFGIKQAAVPMGSLLGGAAVPVLALTLGWRWAFGLASVIVGVLLVVTLTAARPRLVDVSLASRRPEVAAPASMPSLVALCVAAVFGTAAGNSLATFLAIAAVDIGIGPAAAGVLVAVASGAGVAMRVIVGWGADRHVYDHLRTILAIMAVATCAFGVLAVGSGLDLVPMFVVAAFVGFGAGWGWHGLMTYAIVRLHPDAPAFSTGMLQGGI